MALNIFKAKAVDGDSIQQVTFVTAESDWRLKTREWFTERQLREGQDQGILAEDGDQQLSGQCKPS